MRPRFNVDERRTTPCTSYPFASRSSARYEPSWPVMPVISAVLVMGSREVYWLWNAPTRLRFAQPTSPRAGRGMGLWNAPTRLRFAQPTSPQVGRGMGCGIPHPASLRDADLPTGGEVNISAGACDSANDLWSQRRIASNFAKTG